MSWTIAASIAVPFLLILISTLVTEFEDPDHNPETPPPVWVRILKVVQLMLSVRAPEGRAGIGGTQWSLPMQWPKKVDPVIGNVIGAGPKEGEQK